MHERCAKLAQSAQVFGCAVPFVLCETVAWKFLVERAHDTVTRNFGEDGRGSNGERERVTMNNALLWNVNLVQNERVEQEGIGLERELLKGAIHGKVRGAEDVELVYFGLRSNANRKGARELADGVK